MADFTEIENQLVGVVKELFGNISPECRAKLRAALAEDETTDTKQSSILDELWVIVERATRTDIMCWADWEWQRRATTVTEFADLIAASPDMARALKMIQDKAVAGHDGFITSMLISPDKWKLVTDALVKAGIE